jgi:Chromosome segregation ATPases
MQTERSQNEEHVRNIEQQKNVTEEELKQRDATIATTNAEIERISSAFSRVQNELKEREATIAANSAEIERISSAFSRVQNELKEREAQLTESQQQHEREIGDLETSVQTERIQLAAKSSQTAELADKLLKLNQDVKNFAEVFGLTRQRLQDSNSAAAVLIQSLFHDIRLIRKRKSLWKACRLLRSTLSRGGTQDIPSNPKVTAEVLKQKLRGYSVR